MAAAAAAAKRKNEQQQQKHWQLFERPQQTFCSLRNQQAGQKQQQQHWLKTLLPNCIANIWFFFIYLFFICVPHLGVM